MISYAVAKDLLREKNNVLRDRACALQEAHHQIASETVHAPFALPAFRNSSMDGFAVVASETEQASVDTPITLKNAMTVLAGHTDSLQKCVAGVTCEVMTGARVPEGFNAVVPIEDVTVFRDAQQKVTRITLKKPVRAGQYIREAGEDFSKGDDLLHRGDRITAAHIMALSALGCHTIRVMQPLRIALLSTGSEVISDLHCALKPGQIYDANRAYLQAALKQYPVELFTFHLQEDRVEAFCRVMETIEKTGADIVISIGAVSMGAVDFIPEGLQQCGAQIIFHRVAIKPGKPILFAERAPQKFFFGLPGNPASTAVGLRFFVIPFLRHLFSLPEEKPVRAHLTHSGKNKSGLQFFLKAYAAANDEGVMQVEVLPGQESFKIRPLLQANGWVMLPASSEEYQKDQLVYFFEGV